MKTLSLNSRWLFPALILLAGGSRAFAADEIAPDAPIEITFTVTNTGKRGGDDMAQIYYHHQNSKAPQPERSLCGFAFR